MSELIERWVLARAFPDNAITFDKTKCSTSAEDSWLLGKNPGLRDWLASLPEQEPVPDPVLPGRLAQLVQFLDGPVAEKELVSKTDRNVLVLAGYADTAAGYTFLTIAGVHLVEQLGFLKH